MLLLSPRQTQGKAGLSGAFGTAFQGFERHSRALISSLKKLQQHSSGEHDQQAGEDAFEGGDR